MTTYSSEFIAIPERFRGLRVLLIEPDKSSLNHHARILSQNFYQVTTTSKVATGLSKIVNIGESYDCVMIDADIPEMDMVDFLHKTFKNQPQLSIIMMASDNIGMRIFKETLGCEEVFYLLKPFGPREICNIWQHVCRKRISHEEVDYSNGESPKENPEPNIFKSVDPMVKQSTTAKPKLMNDHNISSGSGTLQISKINSHEYGAMFRPIRYEWSRSNDHKHENVDETYLKEKISSTGIMKNLDKGKEPVHSKHKRRDYQVSEDDKYCKKSKDTKRITWTDDLHRKFVAAINSLGKQKVYPTAILEIMNVPGLTRSQVASHLQKYQDHQKNIKNKILEPQIQRENCLQVESYGHKICGQSTPSDNIGGMLHMTINNIKARLQRAPSLPVTINLPYSDQSSMGETSMITTFGDQINKVQITDTNYGIADVGDIVAPVNASTFSNDFFSENGGGVIASLTPLDYSRTESWVYGTERSNYGLGTALEPLRGFAIGGETKNPKLCELSNLFGMTNSAVGGSIASSVHHDPEHLLSPKSVSGYVNLLHSQNSQGYGEIFFPNLSNTTTLVDVEHSVNPNFSNSDFVPIGVETVGYSHPRLPGEANNGQAQTLPPMNPTVFVDGFVESDLFSNESPCDQIEMTVNLLDDLDAHLINGPW